MNAFCMLAYIPSIILIVWLLIEVRKFMIVSKDLRQTELAWDKLEHHRKKKQLKQHTVETIPPQPSNYYSEERSDQYDYDYDTGDYTTDYYPAPPPTRSRHRSPRRSRKTSSRTSRRSKPRYHRGPPADVQSRPRRPPQRARKKPLEGYDEELGYETDSYYDSRNDVDWD